MLIQVSKQDITEGKQEDGTLCPVALALKRLKLVDVLVLGSGICCNGRYARTPRSVQRFVAAFDSNKPVHPFQFKLPKGLIT